MVLPMAVRSLFVVPTLLGSLLLLNVVPLSRATCGALDEPFNNCQLCASAVSSVPGFDPTTGPFMQNCWWCEETQTCHQPLSALNKCGSNSAKRSDFCPIKKDDPSVYDPAWAKKLSMYANVGYCRKEVVSSWDLHQDCRGPTAGFVVDAIVQHHEMLSYGYVGHNDAEKRIIVAFKGTNGTNDGSFKDLGTDLMASMRLTTFYQNECSFGPKSAITHHGFCEYHRSLNDGSAEGGSLHEHIVKVHARYPHYEVWFTGHSLGGAAAALQATLWGVLTGTKGHLMTYGEPRVGDSSFAALLTEHTTRSMRVTHARDPIPHVSPCCSYLGTAGCGADAHCPFHHGTEVWYPSGFDESKRSIPGHYDTYGYAQYRVATQSGEDPEGSNGLGFEINIGNHNSYFGMHPGYCCGKTVITNQYTGKCLDVAKGDTHNGANVVISECNGSPSQNWAWVGGEGGGPARALLNTHSNKCLDAVGWRQGSFQGEGANVQIYDCNGRAADQWIESPKEDEEGSIMHASINCLDDASWGKADGSNVLLWHCTTGGNQKWKVNFGGDSPPQRRLYGKNAASTVTV